MYGPEINRSYFFAIDNKHGWGNTSYFTFFSEFNRTSRQDAYIEVGFLTTLFVLSVIGNSSVIGFIFYCRDLRTTTNCLVCNLALADILFVTSGPFIAHVRITDTWTLGAELCHLINYSMFVCGTVMIWKMAVISIDRFLCINSKGASPRRIRPMYMFGICSLIWIIFIPLFCPIAIYFVVISVQTETSEISFCSVIWPTGAVSYSAVFTLCVFAIGFVIPFVIIIVNYTRIFKALRSTRTFAHGTQELTQPSLTSSIKQRNIRVVKTLVLLVLLFFLMLIPLFTTFFLIQQDAWNQRFLVPSHALIWTIIVSYANACINPFVYGFLNNKLKGELSSVCKCDMMKFTGVRPSKTTPVQTINIAQDERL